MRRFAALLALCLVLSLTNTALADIPPSPPPGLKSSPGLRPIPVAVIGIALAGAVAASGLLLARFGKPLLFGLLGLAVVVLVVAGVLAVEAYREQEEQAVLQAEYDRALKNWHPRGPVRRPEPPPSEEVPKAVTVFAAAPEGCFPHNLPWAGLALNARNR